MRKSLSIIVLLLSIGSITLMAQPRKSVEELMKEAYELKGNEIKVAYKTYKNGMSLHPILHSIERCKDETKVTFLQPIYWDYQWMYYGPGYTIVDKRSGDQYKARSVDSGIPLELLTVRGCNGKYIFITLVFPKLKKSVKYIDIIEFPTPIDEYAMPSNNTGENNAYYNIKVEDYLVSHKENPKVFK